MRWNLKEAVSKPLVRWTEITYYVQMFIDMVIKVTDIYRGFGGQVCNVLNMYDKLIYNGNDLYQGEDRMLSKYMFEKEYILLRFLGRTRMKTFEELILVNYCYSDCIPLMNIMRLPKEEAFALASAFAESHPETTAFYRFADFDNYYSLREEQDKYLYARFVKLGGVPEEEHPLSFVIEGSEYLQNWFGKGIESRLRLGDILPCHISFTVGDSGAEYKKNRSVELLTMEDIKERLQKYGNDFEAFMKATGKSYIEVQLWSDKYITEEYLLK